MTRISIAAGPWGSFGVKAMTGEAEGDVILIQSARDVTRVARSFGWSASTVVQYASFCDHRMWTPYVISCPGCRMGTEAFVRSARAWLATAVEWDLWAEDPGLFTS